MVADEEKNVCSCTSMAERDGASVVAGASSPALDSPLRRLVHGSLLRRQAGKSSCNDYIHIPSEFVSNAATAAANCSAYAV